MADPGVTRIGLDIDGVLANFNQGVLDRAREMGLADQFPPRERWITSWNYSPAFGKVWETIVRDYKFWLGLKPYPGVLETIDFEVSAYVTARPVPSMVSYAWLENNGFPVRDAMITTVGPEQSKVDVLLNLKIGLFVDDKPDNFDEINKAGLCGIVMRCLLYDQPWNRQHEADKWRITSLSQVLPKLDSALPLGLRPPPPLPGEHDGPDAA